VTLTGPEAVALDLFHKEITVEEEEKTIGLTPSLSFGWVADIGVEEALEYQFRYKVLKPIITAFVKGSLCFIGSTKACRTSVFAPVSKHVLIVLPVPKGSGALEATLEYTAIIAKRQLGVWVIKEVKTGGYPVKK
jgi:hypothetical protein